MRRRVIYLGVALGFWAGIQLGFASSDPDQDPAYAASTADTHWAFAPLQKPATPVVDVGAGNEVDAFIIEKLRERGLKPNNSADKWSLIRRVTYDLTGLPPTFEETQAFLADESPEAYENLVERLLDSPAYGERWAENAISHGERTRNDFD